MALIALAADKGSPGVTTAAVALSAVWPRRALLAEADPAGGDLVYRSVSANGGPLDPNMGMLSLAAAARRGLAAEQLWDHSQRLSGGLDVLVGLGAAEQSAGLAGQWSILGRSFAALADSPYPEAAADVLADCGRIGPESASVALFEHAALVLLVTRGEPEQLARVRDRAVALSSRLHGGQSGLSQLGQPLIGVLLVADAGGAAKTAGQVNEMLIASRAGAQVMGVIAQDAAGADQLAGRRRGRLEKSLLVRSVRKVAADLHQQYGAAWSGQDAGVPQGPVPPAAPEQGYRQQQYAPPPAPEGPPAPATAAPVNGQAPYDTSAPVRPPQPASPAQPYEPAPAPPAQPYEPAPAPPAQPYEPPPPPPAQPYASPYGPQPGGMPGAMPPPAPDRAPDPAPESPESASGSGRGAGPRRRGSR